MADYDTQGMMRSNLSATVMYPNGGQPSPGPNIYHGNGSGNDVCCTEQARTNALPFLVQEWT